MSIREHGGAVRYWRHSVTGRRAVLCRDGLLLEYRAGRWLKASLMIEHNLEHNPNWQEDTRPAMTAAITRTNREARRRS